MQPLLRLYNLFESRFIWPKASFNNDDPNEYNDVYYATNVVMASVV